MYLVSQPFAVEVLDTLRRKKSTIGDLCGHVGTSPRKITRTLRVLAANDLISREQHSGTWDRLDKGETAYHLTDEGHHIVERLLRLEEWTAMYEAAFPSPNP